MIEKWCLRYWSRNVAAYRPRPILNGYSLQLIIAISWYYCITSVVIFNTPGSIYAYDGWNRSFRSAVSIWFEIGVSWIRVNNISIFPGKFPRNLDFFRQIFKKFIFFPAIKKKIDFARKNCSFTATSGQIVLGLFLFKSHHFQTYFLYIIRYNNISRPPATAPRPLPKIWGSRPPNPWFRLTKLWRNKDHDTKL